uniref:IRS-type PTB domain-containing protein n=1 Tax=Bursaphelenchus xylophilus TaxID=6326 RepID=A0A1I7SSE3_BURXY
MHGRLDRAQQVRLLGGDLSELRTVFRRSMLLQLSRRGYQPGYGSLAARPEHTEPTVLVTSHHRSSQHIQNPVSSQTNEGLIESSLSRPRRDSQDSQLADAEVCEALRNRRCRTTSEEMADEDVLLDEDCGANEDFGNNEAGRGIHSRRRVSPETPSPETVRGFKMCAPNKTQVLNYIATTKSLCIRRAGTELQVTDTTGFPLLDVWQKTSCFSSTWVLESYGRTVLLLTDSGRSWKPWNFNQPKSNFLEVTDEEDEIVGYFQVGEPFVVQNKDRTPIARFMGYESGDGRTILFQCVLECSGEEVGRLEPRKSQLSQLRFSPLAISFQLKLLVLAAAIRIAALPQPAGCPVGNQRVKKRNKKGVCCSIV